MWCLWTHRASGASSASSDAERSRPDARLAGATLVEVMVGVVLLVVIALAGASYMYHSRVTLGVQKAHRIAVELANAQLETIRALPYGAITNACEMRNVDGGNFPVTTRVVAIDADGAAPTNDCKRVTVIVAYRVSTGECVTLETIQFPNP